VKRARVNKPPRKITGKDQDFKWFHETAYGKIFNGDSYQFIPNLDARSVDLIVTSPPFGLVREKEYGNVPADSYIDWFRPYATQFHRLLKKSGSLCVTGEICERLRRRWLCVELQEPYLKGAIGQFSASEEDANSNSLKKSSAKSGGSKLQEYFKLPRIGLLWGKRTTDRLPKDGGKTRPASVKNSKKQSSQAVSKCPS